jgi:hypothetical protein
LGIEVPARFRATEVEALSDPFLRHTLALNDVLIAAECLAAVHPRIELVAVRHERSLKHQPVRVMLPTGRERIVIPDGWLDWRLDGRFQACICLELDRGTQGQKAWRDKLAALVAFANGPYQHIFETSALTIAVVTPGGERRMSQLLAWTEAELRILGQEQMRELFVFAGLDAAVTSPEFLFLDPVWTVPLSRQQVPLLWLEGVGQ